MKSINLTQKLIADLMAINVKLHGLHWNVVGDSFEEYHELTELFYNDVFLKFDELAEFLKTIRHYPIDSLTEMASLTTVQSIDSRDFTPEELLTEVKSIYVYLIDSFKNLRTVAIEEDEFVLVNLLETYIADYNKNLWMIEARSK